MDAGFGFMCQDAFGYYYTNLHNTTRDLTHFGQLFLDGGVYQGNQIIPEKFVEDFLASYSQDVRVIELELILDQQTMGINDEKSDLGIYV